MFYETLLNINHEKNLEIPTENLSLFSDEIKSMMLNNSISPNYLSRKSKINLKEIEILLSNLVSYEYISPKFHLRCDNEDNDLIHSYDFDSLYQVNKFLHENNSCLYCDSNLKYDVKVTFIKNKNCN